MTQNLRFPGQYFDTETQLHYNWHRYYSPELGRYITSDPIGLAGGLNTYGYAMQNPLNYFDPNGLCPAGGLICGAIGVGISAGARALIGYHSRRAATVGVIGVAAEIIDNKNDGDDGNVIPFPSSNTTDVEQCDDGNDKCELEYNSIITAEISIRNDISSGPPRYGPNAGNEIMWAADIKAKKKAWNEWVNDYNRRCPRKIIRRFPL